jgi:hypothetical protein
VLYGQNYAELVLVRIGLNIVRLAPNVVQ